MVKSLPALLQRRLPRNWVRLLGTTTLLTATALSSYNAVTTTRFAWDLPITRWAQNVTIRAPLDEILFFMGVIGCAGAIMVVVWLWLWVKGCRVDALVLLFSLLPNGLAFPLRALFDRPRPSIEEVNVIGGAQGASYPSGHGLMVVFIYGFLFLLLTRYSSSRTIKYAALLGLIVYVPFAGLWLVNHGRHWPSDVLGGYLYGLLCLTVWGLLYERCKRWDERHPDFFTVVTLRRVAIKVRLALTQK